MGEIRLQKFLSIAGVCSRRKGEELILNGSIKVNGAVVCELGTKVNDETDIVEVDGVLIVPEKRNTYIMLNKPRNVITSTNDEHGRKTVIDIISGAGLGRVYPVGRLDYETEGLLFLTDDGNLTYRLTHPKHHIKKVYIARVNGIPKADELMKFGEGLEIDGYKLQPCEGNIIDKKNGEAEVLVTIYEGRNRQVRKMFEKIGYRVINLKRISVGDISLGNLPYGKWRFLTENEIKYLKNIR